jgi:hypothetical protein
MNGHYQDCDDPSSQANILNLGIEHAPGDHGTSALYAVKEMITNSMEQKPF